MLIFLAILLILTLALTALYLNRRLAAREVLVGWLDRQGIEADVEVERLELSSFIGKITIGDPQSPQVRVDRVEVDYALGMPWSKTGLGLTPSRIRLVQPVARASFKGGVLSLGVLDPLIERFTARPPQPDSRAPLVIIERGQAFVDTDYGPVQILANARLDNSRLISLKAELPSATLKTGPSLAEDLAVTLSLVTQGDVVTLDLSSTATRLQHQGLITQDTEINLTGTLPYPDAKSRQSRGPVNLTGQLTSAQVLQGETRANGVAADLNLKGELKGWLDTFTLIGATQLDASAQSMTSGNNQARGLTLQSQRAQLALSRDADQPLRWQIQGPAELGLDQLIWGETRLSRTQLSSQSLTLGGQDQKFEASGPVNMAAASLTSGDIHLRDAQGRLALDLVRDSVTRLSLGGTLSVKKAAYLGLGAVNPEDVPELAQWKRALADFSIRAPSVMLRAHNDGIELNLLQAIQLRPAQGGQLDVSAADAPLIAARAHQPAGGAFKLISQPQGGLPKAELLVSRWQQVSGGIKADVTGHADLDFGPAKGINLNGSGVMTTIRGETRFDAPDCLNLTMDKIDLGENDLSNLSGRLCPTEAGLLRLNGGQAHLQTRPMDVSGQMAGLDLKFDQGQALIALINRPTGLTMNAQIEQLGLTDTSGLERFLPLNAKGQFNLANQAVTGSLSLDRRGQILGHATLNHQIQSGTGHLDISTSDLSFTQAGLQPADISPLVGQFIQSPVEGTAQFTGQFQWSENASSSAGRISTPRLDFVSSVGTVQGLSGQVDFISLLPLVSAPNQRLSVNSLQTVVPLTDLDLNFELRDRFLQLDGGIIHAAGGQISIEPISIPLEPGTAWGGVINIYQVQLNDLLKSANLHDRVLLDSIVSGRLPFIFSPDEGWKIHDGKLASVRPGRLSIAPEALDELNTGVAPADAVLPPNTMQDLAYQAMQDLAISDLKADVNSLDNGRLGINFHISGRHDPPQREQLRMTVLELIRRDFLNKKLNLPSDTPIDLTLDTTWNANQIASDIMDYVRRGEKPAIQD